VKIAHSRKKRGAQQHPVLTGCQKSNESFSAVLTALTRLEAVKPARFTWRPATPGWKRGLLRKGGVDALFVSYKKSNKKNCLTFYSDRGRYNVITLHNLINRAIYGL
jgi:hypothetical protein